MSPSSACVPLIIPSLRKVEKIKVQIFFFLEQSEILTKDDCKYLDLRPISVAHLLAKQTILQIVLQPLVSLR